MWREALAQASAPTGMPKRTDIESILIIGAGPSSLLPLPAGERVGVRGRRGSSAQVGTEPLENAVQIVEDLVVPDADDRVSGGSKIGVTDPIPHAFRVLSAIDLDDQPCFLADEIDDVWADRHLSAELPSREPSISHGEPEFPFGIGHGAPHGARMFLEVHGPSPQPSPPRGRGSLAELSA